MTLRLLGPKGRVSPNVPIDGICSKPFQETCHDLDTLLPSVPPVYRLCICLITYPLRTWVLPQEFSGGQPASGHAFSLSFSLFSSLLFLDLGLPLLFSVIKGIGGYLDHLI